MNMYLKDLINFCEYATKNGIPIQLSFVGFSKLEKKKKEAAYNNILSPLSPKKGLSLSWKTVITCQ